MGESLRGFHMRINLDCLKGSYLTNALSVLIVSFDIWFLTEAVTTKFNKVKASRNMLMCHLMHSVR
jgi:hypothetical protein